MDCTVQADGVDRLECGRDWMKVQRRQIILAVVVGSVMLILMSWITFRYIKGSRFAKIGDIAPDIQTTTLSGQSFSLDSLRGQPILLNFFTPWCPPCIQETPDLSLFAKEYGSKVHVVLIDRGDGSLLVSSYVNKYHLPNSITVLLNTNDIWSQPYGVTGQPETFLIRPNGVIAYHLIGPLTEPQMVQLAQLSGMKG